MDGKFYKKGFCVLLSKIYEIDLRSIMKNHRDEATADGALQDNLVSLQNLADQFKLVKAKITKAERSMKTLRRKRCAAQRRSTRHR
jgi:hypothetical protein